MSFLTATNTELIYNAEAAGADLASTTATLVTLQSGGAAPAAYLPPVFSIWQPSTCVGKGFRVVLGGVYNATAVGVTLKYSLDGTFGTQSTTNPGVIASTASFVVPSTTAGAWSMAFDVVFTAVSGGGNLSGFVNGLAVAGVGNNAGTAGAAIAVVGGTSTTGTSASTFTTWPGTTAFYWELQATWATAPTHFSVQQHQIFGLN